MTQNTIGIKANRKKILIRPGEYLQSGGKTYKINQLIDFETVIGVEISTGKSQALQISNLQPVEPEKHINNLNSFRDIATLNDSEWLEIERRFEIISPIIHSSSRKEIEARANAFNIHYTTLYRWLNNYRATGTLTGLLRQKPGSKKGSNRLERGVELIIEDVINNYFLTKQRPSVQRVIEQVSIECHKLNFTPPSPNTIRSRIHKISDYERLRKQGNRSKAQTKYKPAPGNFPNADYPLSIVQIDHTPADIILVDDESRLPIGRPWITLAIDIYSRMVTGYYLSLDAPSETSVAMCIANSVLPKDDCLIRNSVEAEWPVWGFMQTIHVDNGADFRSETLKRSCLAHNINLEFRPVGQPNFGGHIERLLGTLLKHIHSLPGTTFSNIKERDSYDSDKHASMTFSEFEKWLVSYITRVYHQRKHHSLSMSPLQKWENGIFGDMSTEGIGYLPKPTDKQTVMIDFLPLFERTIQKNGVNIDGLNYYDNVIRHWINTMEPNTKTKRSFIFRRDPRDISFIWFYEPELKTYFKLPLANQAYPSLSLWEYRAARDRMRERGISSHTDHAVIEALDELHQQAEASIKKSKQSRRKLQKRKMHSEIKTQTPTMDRTINTDSTENDLWDSNVESFD